MSIQHVSILRDESGAAFAEAIISLPVFIALLGGVVAVNGMYEAKMEAKSRARRLAWLQADSGLCPERSCRSPECSATEQAILSDGVGGLQRIADGPVALGSFLRRMRDYFVGTYTDGIATARAPMPATFHSSFTVQRGTTTLLCNTTGRHTHDGESILERACATDLRSTEYAREVCR